MEPVLVESDAALLAAGGAGAPPVVMTHHNASDRAPLIRELREAGIWVIGVTKEEHLGRLSEADDLLPLPATVAAFRARLRLASSRSASVGTLASSVAHEINNPLAITMANLEFALEELTTPKPDFLETLLGLREALDGANRVRAIVKELHAFANGKSEGTKFQGGPTVITTTRRGRILLVDDEPLLARTIERTLSEHDIVSETDARHALQRIVSGQRFDVILCDLMMPEMSGMDLHAELGRIAPDQQQRMVFMTGGAFTPAAQAFLKGLEQTWLSKPFEAARLRAAITSRLS